MVSDGWVMVKGQRILACGDNYPHGAPPCVTADTVVEGILAPGFIDAHCHGGGGASFGADPDHIETVLGTHSARGTTTMVASLVTAPIAQLCEQVRALAPFVADGRLAGIHLEGPWLSAEYRGAHSEEYLAEPRIEDLASIIEASNNTICMVTIAPEKPGALEMIRYCCDHGISVAIGHTGADYDTTCAAIEAGARGTTHLFNAMPAIHHRSPGPALALWRDNYVELIMDGVHLHPDLGAHVMATAPTRAVLISDAMAAAGCEDGDYYLGDQAVEVGGGVARLADTSTIAGSTLTLDKAIRVAVRSGVELETALMAATANPANYLGLTETGLLSPGRYADLVCLDWDLTVTAVMRRGEWL